MDPSSTQPYEFTVLLKSASHLIAADTNGLSDPFVIVTLGRENAPHRKQTSKTIPKTLNPVWNETFKFSENKLLAQRSLKLTDKIEIHFNVMDHDLVGRISFVICSYSREVQSSPLFIILSLGKDDPIGSATIPVTSQMDTLTMK